MILLLTLVNQSLLPFFDYFPLYFFPLPSLEKIGNRSSSSLRIESLVELDIGLLLDDDEEDVGLTVVEVVVDWLTLGCLLMMTKMSRIKPVVNALTVMHIKISLLNYI